MSTLVSLILIFLALFFHLFLYWRRLKEDYSSPQIFLTAFLTIFLTAATAWLTLVFLVPRLHSSPIFEPSGLWFWSGTLGFILSMLVVVYRFHFQFFETLEANVPGILLFLFSLLLTRTLFLFTLPNLLGCLVLLALVIFYYLLNHHYKKFSWYHSGKVGFSGLVVLAVFFLLRAAVAVHFGTMLSLSGRVEIVASSVAAFLLFFAVYNLSEL